ncbi:MAG: factor-independent urate hydroxylase [Ignavibacteria bacterium]
MSVIISKNNYGKSGIRVLKVKRDTKVHEIIEMTVSVQLEGDFEKVHTEGDNTKVLPTDTMKNTVYALAKDQPVNSIEEFGTFLAKYFLDNNKQVSKTEIGIEEKLWNRIMVDDNKNHDHSFISAGNEKRTAKITADKNGVSVVSGITDLLLLKTTGSGFENYVKDKFTKLKETDDRVFSTSIKTIWKYVDQEVSYFSMSGKVRNIILKTFAEHHSLSVQQTLYEIGKNVIETITDITEITMTMPNKHYHLFNLEQFNMENKNEIFIPTDEPFGLIEATVRR